MIGQSPGRNEVEEGKPFIGPSGELIDFLLDEVGVNREQVYITNALKCRPPSNRPAYEEELFNCRQSWLQEELKIVKPKVIVTFGKDALMSLSKGTVKFQHNTFHKGKNRFLVVSYHPAYFLRTGNIEEFLLVGQTIKDMINGQ